MSKQHFPRLVTSSIKNLYIEQIVHKIEYSNRKEASPQNEDSVKCKS